MEFTSASANKYLRRLQDEKDRLLRNEQEVSTYVLAEGEAAEPPAYDYGAVRGKVAQIDRLHAAHGNYDGIVYNPGAHTHYSYALHDAVECIDVPVVEIHISDISKREEFRRRSVIAPACIAQVKGLGKEGYLRALDILLEGE